MPTTDHPLAAGADDPVLRLAGTIAVQGSGPLAEGLRAGLASLGARVADGLADLAATSAGCAGADDGGARTDPLSAAVFAPWDPADVVPVALVDLTDEQFGAAWQQTMDDAVAFCSAARTRFGDAGGRIVLTVPTIALAGGARHAHWAAAAEGVHLLAKSAARQWGPEGITVNTLAVGPSDVLADPGSAGPVSIATPALGSTDPAAVCAFLCSPAAAHLTGQTLVVDEGLWM